ncbi:NAD(+)/NADH kinase [Candidatus Heimdallarchaeota archaeon]|nr:MAG: NAD(+)/NADH kinase [Candidatus Heimdallarchaeota archaeon]
MSFLNKDACVLVTSSRHQDSIELALAFHEKLLNKGYTSFLDTFLAKKIDDPKYSCDTQKPSIVFVFGGDGTILKTYEYWKNVPIFGINCGKVGFLTEIDPNDIEEALERLEQGEGFVESFNTIQISSKNSPPISAVNDVVVTSDRIGQSVSLKLYVDDQYVYTLDGDGLIVATSIGSSAYGLSAGGSLIVPAVEAIITVPICPFSRRVVPMVFPLNSTLKVVNGSKYKNCVVVIDGKVYYDLDHKESIIIQKSDEKINFVRFTENYITRVREKLLRFNPDDVDE